MVQVLSPKYQCHDHNTYILAILHVWYLPQCMKGLTIGCIPGWSDRRAEGRMDKRMDRWIKE